MHRVFPALLLILAATASSACGGGGGTDASSATTLGATYETVAILQLLAPEALEFPLRGTLPVPPGTVLVEGASGSFGVRHQQGPISVAQVEIVSRYPRAEDGADVIEIIARVERPADALPGEDLRYEVVHAVSLGGDGTGGSQTQPHDLGEPLPPALPDSVNSLITVAAQVLLRAQDAYGNYYVADLMDGLPTLDGVSAEEAEHEFLRFGPECVQARTYHVLLPSVGGSGPALPHLFGVHAYVTVWPHEEVVSLDLRIHDGFDGHDQSASGDDPLGKVYFKELELLVPKGWQAHCTSEDPEWSDPYTASVNWEAYAIAGEPAPGKLHVMPHQGQMHRRIWLSPTPVAEHAVEMLEAQGLAFCQPGFDAGNELWSWWNWSTARYFPQCHALPQLGFLGSGALRAEMSAKYWDLQGLLESGAANGYPVTATALGWAHPYGVSYGGATGGEGINLWEGVETAAGASALGYRYYEVLHRMQMERMPVALYGIDGEPTALADWLILGPNGLYAPMFFYLTLKQGTDPFGFAAAPTFQVDYVQSQGLAPDYEAELLSYEPIDIQHLVRVTRAAKSLAWLANDALAKDDLELLAELSHLSYHPYFNSDYNHVQSSGLLSDLLEAQANPHKGVDFGRGEGWMLDCAVAAYRLGTAEWRAANYPWFEEILEVPELAQSQCTGIIQGLAYEKLLEGKYRARQSIEQAIVESALRSAIESVWRGTDPELVARAEAVLRTSLMSMVLSAVWSPTGHAPYSQFAVGPLDLGQPLFCDAVPSDGKSVDLDSYQCWSSLALGYEMTGGEVFLARAEEMAGGPLLQSLQNEGLDNLQNRAALLALAQLLGR